MIMNNILFILHTMPNKPIEGEISLSNKATLSQSDLIQTFFIIFTSGTRVLLLLFESITSMHLLHFSTL